MNDRKQILGDECRRIDDGARAIGIDRKMIEIFDAGYWLGAHFALERIIVAAVGADDGDVADLVETLHREAIAFLSAQNPDRVTPATLARIIAMPNPEGDDKP